MPRPKFQPTDEQRYRVRALAKCHVRREQIACILGLKSVAMLRKHFSQELAMGAAEAKNTVLTRLFDLATSGRHPSATMFWLKTRARWSEKGNRRESRGGKQDHTWVITEYQPPLLRNTKARLTKPCATYKGRADKPRPSGRETRATHRRTHGELETLK
jgi:hypothetical protein